MAAPKIVFDSESLDLGKIVSGKPINVTFTFRNAGDSELEITAVRPGCGCTKAEAKKNKLAPGESSTITALFNSTGFNGPVSKAISVSTNDPARSSISLSFKAEIVALAKLKPERLNFGSIKAGESRTHTLLVYPGDPKTFTITKVVPQGSHASVPSFRKVTSEAGDYWQLTVLVKADKKPGRIMESLNIHTGPGDNDKFSVLVYGNIIE